MMRYCYMVIRCLYFLHDLDMEDLHYDHTSADRDVNDRELGVDASQHTLVDIRHRKLESDVAS